MADYNLKIIDNKVIFDGHAENSSDCHTLTLLCNLLQKNTKTVDYRTGYAEFELEDIPSENRFLLTDTQTFYINDILVRVAAAQSSGDAFFVGASLTIDLSFSQDGVTVHNTGTLACKVKLVSDLDLNSYFSITSIPSIAPGGTALLPFLDNIKLRSILSSDGQEISEGDVISDNETKLTVSKIKSVDLTTLSGWADLTDGNHTIQIVAKADGYQDSEKSAGVEVTKELQYDYKFENNVLQIYKAPYTFTDGTVWIKSEPSLQLTDYKIIEDQFLPDDEIELTNDRQFVKDIHHGLVKTFFDNQPYADSVEAFMTLKLDNSEPSVYGNYLYTYEIITPFEFFVLKQDSGYTFEATRTFRLEGTLKSPAFIGEKSGDTETNSQFVIMLIDMKSAKCYFQKTKEINGELGTLKFDDAFNIFGLLGIIKRGNVLGNDTYEFVATPDFEGLSNEVDIDCYGTFPTVQMDFDYGITINPIEKSIIFNNVSDSPSGEWDETDWGYKNGVWGYDKNETRVADDRIRTLSGITTEVALSDEAYAFWQKNTTIKSIGG